MITPAQLKTTGFWLDRFRDMLVANPPIRLHARSLDYDGNPDWHPEFMHWISGTSGRTEGSEDRARLRRALKRLRERSLRESEVLEKVLVQGMPIPEVTDWLNLRSVQGGHPERYTVDTTLVILYAAVDKACSWW